MQQSIALQNAESIHEVVNMINRGGTSEHFGFQIAGKYAYFESKKNMVIDCKIPSFELFLLTKSINEQLNILSENGAIFDRKRVIDYIQEMCR